MIKIVIVAISSFIIFTFVFYKISIKKYKAENSEKMWKLFGMRTMYWQGIIIVSGLFTILLLYLLKIFDILTLD